MSDDVCYHELAGNKSVPPADRRQTLSSSTDRDAKSAKICQDPSTVYYYSIPEVHKDAIMRVVRPGVDNR